MVVTNGVDLPEFKDLTVTECDLSTATLMSAAPYVGKHCENINNEFMLCRYETGDPRACVDIGKQVTACTLELFRKIKDSCKLEFNQYANCIDKSSGNYAYQNCRKTQAVFDACMDEKLCLTRPGFGHFCRARIHKTTMPPPPPEPCPCAPKVPDPTPSLPDCKPRPPARFGNRAYYFNE